MSQVAKTNTNNPNCSCSGHDIPQYGKVSHTVACCEIPHAETKRTPNPEIGMCKAHEDQHFKADDCDGWKSECERKGHVYWNHGQESEGSRCLDCGTPKVVVTACVNVHEDNSVCNMICELGTPCCVCSDRGEQEWCERCLKRNYTW